MNEKPTKNLDERTLMAKINLAYQSESHYALINETKINALSEMGTYDVSPQNASLGLVVVGKHSPTYTLSAIQRQGPCGSPQTSQLSRDPSRLTRFGGNSCQKGRADKRRGGV